MACTLSNKCAKNLPKQTVLLQLIIKNVVTCFFGTQCIYLSCGNANCKHAMLMSCASVEISQQTRWLFWRDVAVRLSFTNFFSDWPSVDPELPTAPYDQKDFDVFCRRCWQQKWLDLSKGQVRRQTIYYLHSKTGSVASCYKSHRLSVVCDH